MITTYFELINIGQKTPERYTTRGRKGEFSTVGVPTIYGSYCCGLSIPVMVLFYYHEMKICLGCRSRASTVANHLTSMKVAEVNHTKMSHFKEV
jgi:hypothetical protein